MISKNQNNALQTIAKEALKNPFWYSFAEYCINREKGLRNQAFKELNEFILLAEKWNFEDKVELLKFLFPLFESIDDADYVAFPQPLREKLMKPTLEKWCLSEKLNSQPFRWYGKYYRSEEHLFKALEINPKDDLSRETILAFWCYKIYYSIHHLPEGYIGEPKDDLKLVEEIKQQISLLTDSERKKNWTNEIDEDLELIENYLEWNSIGHSNLEQWGKENNKRVGYNLSRVYYQE